MTETDTGYPPVRVHIVADATKGQAPAPAPVARKRAVTMQTVLLSATNPVQQLLNENPSRREAWIIPSGDGEFLLSRSETQANHNSTLANNASGTPEGVFVPKPTTPLAVPIPMHTTDPVWASGTTSILTGATTIRIGVIEILED